MASDVYTAYLTQAMQRDAYAAAAKVLEQSLAAAPPAATMIVVAGFADPRIRIEIEATAFKRAA